MLKAVAVKIDQIYVPAARRQELDDTKQEEITKGLLNGDAPKPIRVREGKDRFVLIGGVNRLEACKALGETEIEAYIVQAQKF